MAKREVPFFNYPAIFKSQETEIMETFRDVMSRGAFIMQRDLKEFEQNLAEFCGAKFAFGVADGTEAIVISLKAAGIRPGDEVIVPSHTFIASPAAIIQVGAIPVLVDCRADHMIDPESVKKAITRKTRAIMPVQVNGRTADMDAITQIANQNGLLIVEDAAQALGSKFKGTQAGLFGKAGTFSFYPAKLLGCFGDGGGIITNDPIVAEQVFELRDHGRNRDGEIVQWGFNSRLDNMQAALLNLKLKTFPKEIARRREIAQMYQDQLGGLAELQLPPGPNADARHFDVYQNYELEANRRDDLKKYMEENGVRTLVQWSGKAVHQWDKLGFKVDLPYTEKMFTRCLMIPMNTSMSNDDVSYVSEVIRNFYRKG